MHSHGPQRMQPNVVDDPCASSATIRAKFPLVETSKCYCQNKQAETQH